MVLVSRPWQWRYLMIVVSISAALLLSLLLAPWMVPSFIVLLLIVVTINVWYGGLVSGLLSTLLSAVVYAYILAPLRLGMQPDLSSGIELTMFVVVGILISFLHEAGRRGQKAAFQASQHFQAALSSIGDGVITTDLQGRVTLMNHAAEILTGWRQNDALGRDIQGILVLVDEESHQPVDSLVPRALREGQIVRLARHSALIGRDGMQIPIDDSCAPILDRAGQIVGTVLVFRAVAERRQAEKALREAEARFRVAANAVPVLIWMSDPNSMRTFFNQRWLDFTGRTMEQELGTGWSEGVDPDDRERYREAYLTAFETRQPFETEYRLKRFDGEYRWIVDRGLPHSDPDGSFAGYVGSCFDITDRKREAETQRFVAEAAEILSASLDTETTLRNVSRLAVPKLADWFAVDLIAEDLAVQQTVVAHVDASKVALAAELRKRYPLDLAAPAAADLVIRRKSQLIPVITDEMLVAGARDDDYLQAMRALGLRSSMVVPIVGYRRVLGIITLVLAESGRHFNDDDLAAAEELARWVALALENAQAYREAQQAGENARRAAERLARSQAVTEAFSRALTASDVADVVVTQGLAALGADGGLIALLTDSETMLQIVSATGYPPETLQAWHHFPVADPTPLGDAVRSGQPIWVESDEAMAARYPAFNAPKRGSRAAVPLVVNGQTIGAMWLNFSGAREFSAEDQTFVLLQVRKCAQAIDRARLYEAERQARTQAEESRDRLTLLVQINTVLASILDFELRLQSVAHLVIPYLADWCVIDLLDREGSIRRVAMAARDSAKETLLHEIQSQYMPALNAITPMSQVLRVGESMLYPEVTDDLLASLAQDDRHLAVLRDLGFSSMMIVPIAARGRILGAITLVSAESGHRYTADELSLAEEIARRVGLTIDSARLYNEAEEQRERLQVTLSSIGDAVIATDTIGRITFMNGVAEALTGWKFDETGGRHLTDVFHIIDEATREPEESLVTRALRENGMVRLENHTLLIARSGAEIPIDDSAAPIRDETGTIIGIILAFRDITEQRQREAALEETLQRTQDLYETCHRIGLVSTPVEVIQALLTSRYISHAAQCALILFDSLWQGGLPDHFEIAGMWPPDQPLVGFDTNDRLPDCKLARLLSRTDPVYIEDAQTDARLDPATSELFAQAGRCSVMIYPLTAGNRCFGALLLYFAVPQRWTAPDLRHIQLFVEQVCVTMDNLRLFAAEARARQEAEQANEIKLKFLATISHELRTPLTSIKGFATTLLATDVSWDAESQRDFVAIINDEADKLTDLIEQLLDLSRLQAGTLRIQPEVCSMSEIVGTAMAQLESIAAQHRLVIRVSPDLPPVMADAQRIASVLVNLVGNAAKYAPSGTQIAVSAAGRDRSIQVDVSDEGPGIPVESRDKVFEAFWQPEKSSAAQSKGVGLGLAICRGLIHAHGGKIWIADTRSGTTLSFTLPQATGR